MMEGWMRDIYVSIYIILGTMTLYMYISVYVEIICTICYIK